VKHNQPWDGTLLGCCPHPRGFFLPHALQVVADSLIFQSSGCLESKMIRRYSLWVVFLFGSAFLFAAPSHAGDFTFFLGGTFPGSINYKNAEASLDKSPVFGFRLGTNFVPSFGMEHTLAFSSDYLFPRNVSAIRDAKGVLSLPVSVKKCVPYVTVGAGLLHQYGDRDMPVGTKFAFNYGGGLKFPNMVGPVGLRFDLRGYRAGGISNKVNLFEVSGGVLLSFGK
jgi:hypothetical protein